MLDRTALICDDSFEGLLTAVFEAYSRRPMPQDILEPNGQPRLDTHYETVVTDAAKAERVRRGICRQMGREAYENCWKAFLSLHPDRCMRIYEYLQLGFRIHERLVRSLTDHRVMAVNKLASLVSREAGHLLQFVRFAETETGVYYCKIEPTYPVLPLIMPHFVHRLNTQAFVIYDQAHAEAGLYDGKQWVVRQVEESYAPVLTAEERQYQRLWKTFYDTVAITERINPALRRQNMPKKYWRHLTEMQETETKNALCR
ncbi:MAG: TIGR03915 family putative DNA repair protein [Clostridia bacterium]|nr:TIGR03915 family putative DNA repair protein [Clostridia bacterium]